MEVNKIRKTNNAITHKICNSMHDHNKIAESRRNNVHSNKDNCDGIEA
jgi:hypothetical protein